MTITPEIFAAALLLLIALSFILTGLAYAIMSLTEKAFRAVKAVLSGLK